MLVVMTHEDRMRYRNLMRLIEEELYADSVLLDEEPCCKANIDGNEQYCDYHSFLYLLAESAGFKINKPQSQFKEGTNAKPINRA